MRNGPRVLLTGATGFIGRQTIDKLLQLGYSIDAISSSQSLEGHKNLTYHLCDLLDQDSVDNLLKTIQPTHLLHLAWCLKPGEFWTALENIDWVAASVNLVRSFRRSGGRRAVFAGTCAEYDWSFDTCDEATTPIRPATVYGTSKEALHTVLRTISKDQELSIGWGRVFSVYGPYEAEPRLCASILTALMRDEHVSCSDGRQVRDYMHVTDVANALVALLHSDVQGPVNIATGEAHPIATLIEHIAAATGKPELIGWGEREIPAGDPLRLEANVDRLLNEVGFTPRYSLEEGIAQTVDWWRQHNAGQPN